MLIVATGFHTTELPIAEHITGRDGRTLADTWRETGMAAYKGTTVAGFPNLFFDRRPQHRARPLEHGLHDRVAGGLHPSTRSAPCARNDYAAVEVNADAAATTTTPTSSAG